MMKKENLISSDTKAHYKIHSSKPNEEKPSNTINREFLEQEEQSVVISDLTYVRVGNIWNYLSLFIDILNREIIGHSLVAIKIQNWSTNLSNK